MKTKKLGIGLASTALALSIFAAPTADAFFGGGQGGDHGNRPEMTQERFEEMKQLFLSGDFESFKTAMEAKTRRTTGRTRNNEKFDHSFG